MLQSKQENRLDAIQSSPSLLAATMMHSRLHGPAAGVEEGERNGKLNICDQSNAHECIGIPVRRRIA